MKTFAYETHWDEIKGQLKQRYDQLTEKDLAIAEGKSEDLLARLRDKLNMSAKDLNALLEELNSTAAGGLQAGKAKLGALAGDMREKASGVAADMKAKATAAAEEVKTQASAAYDQARQQARGLFSDGEEYVRQNPRESILAALCAGFVAGMLIRR